MKIGSKLSSTQKEELVLFLTRRQGTFAWSIHDLLGVSPSFISHSLGVDPHHPPVWQKRRPLSAEKSAVIDAEVDRLLDAGQIREVQYPSWLANTVVVPKKNGK